MGRKFLISYFYFRLGFASEPYPRYIIPSKVFDVLLSKSQKLFDFENEIDFYDQVIEFFKLIFFKYVLVSPKDRKIVLVETILCPTNVREIFAKALFCHFEVSSIFFVPTHLVVLATLAVETALVVDLGYKEAVVIPVYSGVQVIHACEAQNIAAESVHDSIKTQLCVSGVKEELLTDDVIEDIKVRACFVTTYQRALAYRNGEEIQPCSDVEYPIKAKEVIVIPGKLRETAFESLFPEDNDRLGLPYIILDCVLRCPIDMRKELLENILLIGGTSMANGLASRLKTEILNLLDSDYYKDKFFTKTIKFHNAPAKSNFTGWLGGSIYAGTDLLLTRSLTKETYAKTQTVPDWSKIDEIRTPGAN